MCNKKTKVAKKNQKHYVVGFTGYGNRTVWGHLSFGSRPEDYCQTMTAIQAKSAIKELCSTPNAVATIYELVPVKLK